MTGRASLLCLVCLASACSMTPATRTLGPVPLAYGSAQSFTPLVAAGAGPAECVAPAETGPPSDARAVAVRYAGDPARRITVTLDASGDPIRYVEVRGDLSELDGRPDDRTTIGLYLREGYAVLSNRAARETPTMLEVPLDEALSSPRLGDPSAVMRQVVETCS